MDIDFTTSQPAGGDIKTQAEDKPEENHSATSESDYQPAQASPVSPPYDNPLKEKLNSEIAQTPLPPLQNTQPPAAVKPKGKSGLAWAIAVVIVLGGAAYFLLGTSQGKGLIGLAPKNDLDGLYLTDDNTADIGLPTSSPADSSGAGSSPSSAQGAIPAERDSQRKQDLAGIKMYIDQYSTKNGKYPIAPLIEKIDNTGSTVYAALIPNITTALPNDPWAVSYGYWYGYKSADGSSYDLTARLEDTTDPSGKQEDIYYIYRITSTGLAPTAPDTTSSTTTTAPISQSTIENDLGVTE